MKLKPINSIEMVDVVFGYGKKSERELKLLKHISTGGRIRVDTSRIKRAAVSSEHVAIVKMA
jgi:hypothetical protein